MEHLLDFNRNLGADNKTIHNINRLKDENSVVVIGGQQAGILTGPIYTINKIITILQQAKNLEDRFNIPVLPVFWIAGEDHDFAEINHTFTPWNGKSQKISVKQNWPNKHSVSHVPIDKEACLNWIEDVFNKFGETAFTNKLISRITVSYTHLTLPTICSV